MQPYVIALIAIGGFAVYLTIVMVCLYEKGCLVKIHPMNKHKEGQIKVACVGDSITYGSYHLTKRNYPAVLSKMLGDGYCVNNFGYSGRTAMKDGDMPYVKDKNYKNSLAFMPDKVIIMFGTNDSKPYNWKGAEAFKSNLLEIINAYKALPTSPEIYLLAPSPVWGLKGKPVKFDNDAEVIAKQIRTAVKEMCSAYGYNFIDMYSVFDNKPELFQDGVHPNVAGAKLFAETVYAKVK